MTLVEVALITSAVITAGSKVYSGVSAHQSAQYNAALAEQQAKLERQKGNIAQQKIARQAEKTKSRQRASYGASGVSLKGSPLQTIADTAIEFEKDSAIAAFNAEMGESRARSRAAEYEMKGTQALTSGILEGSGSLISGVGKTGTEAGWWE